jgi:biopolymer transport protein ExbD
MRFPRNAKIFRGQLDAAPFAAVLFLLVIFLLLNSSLVTIPGIRIELPRAADLGGTANPTVVVAVDAHGQLYYDNQPVSEGSLRKRLRTATRSSPQPLTLIVEADRSVSVEQAVVQLGELAREAGIQHLVLATRPKLFSRPPPASRTP